MKKAMSFNKEIVALVDADSIVYDVGIAVDVMNENFGMCKSIINRLMLSIHEHATVIEIYLGSDTNYRKEVATVWPYKGSRDPHKRPFYYNEIRHYLVDQWGAVIINNMEAEDEVSMRSYEFDNFEDFIIVAIDKDLNNTPGLHYNWRRKQNYYVSKVEADRNLFLQALSGDKTDDIPGLYHLLLYHDRAEEAKKLRGSRYKKLAQDELNKLFCPLKMAEYIKHWYDTYDLGKHFEEIFKLVHILRHRKLHKTFFNIYPNEILVKDHRLDLEI
jgi:hypothetical protein